MLCCAFLGTSAFADNLATCSPIGVWYGGSDYKWLLTITPIGGVSYAMRYEGDFSNSAFGYKAWTSVSGRLTKQKNGQYVGQMIMMLTTSAKTPPPVKSYELDAARESMEFVDCNNIKSTISFYGGYKDPNKVPYIDTPDISFLTPGQTIVETYRRMPNTCTVCDQ